MFLPFFKKTLAYGRIAARAGGKHPFGGLLKAAKNHFSSTARVKNVKKENKKSQRFSEKRFVETPINSLLESFSSTAKKLKKSQDYEKKAPHTVILSKAVVLDTL
jgi:hypothetical protein